MRGPYWFMGFDEVSIERSLPTMILLTPKSVWS
jgi:hypothetical protein